MSYRVGVIGLGGIAQRHMAAYRAVAETTVVAGADLIPASRERFRATWGVERTYEDYREMIRVERPDLVSVCTWENSHADLVVGVAELGIVRGILCEKPMAMNLAEADRMIEACERARVRLLVGHMRRYNPHYRRARQLIDEGRLGRVEMMHAYCGGWDMFLWGTHYADMLRYLNADAPIEWVMGQISWRHRGTRYPYSERSRERKGELFLAEDSAVGTMRFANGVRAVLETGVHAEPDWKGVRTDFPDRGFSKLSAYGTLGALVVTDREIGYRAADGRWVEERLMTNEPDGLGIGPFAAEVCELIEAVEQNRETQLGARGGRAALEMMMAIFESARRRGIVELPMDIGDNPLVAMARDGQI